MAFFIFHYMKATIKNIDIMHLVGMKSVMHQGEYARIIELWKRFMPRKNEIKHIKNNTFIALQSYNDFNNFEKPFDIYALVESSEVEDIPAGMQSFIIPSGTYAVFLHKGMNAAATYQSIMTEWLPTSGYEIDCRPHFQVMGEKYKQGSSDSEEDFYVPIKLIKS